MCKITNNSPICSHSVNNIADLTFFMRTNLLSTPVYMSSHLTVVRQQESL